MTLSRSFPIDEGYANALDMRRLDAGLIAREGLFPDPVTVATAGVAYPNGGFNVGALPFVAALKRGGAAYNLDYGVARVANDSAGTAWTIGAPPGSNSRIDLLWIRATDPGEGEATSGTDGPGGVARAVPVFGYTAGVAAVSPVAPALPAGALLVATVTIASTAASIADATIVQAYRFAQAIGGILYARTLAEFSGEAGVVGEEAVTLTSYQRYRYNGTAWVVAPYELAQAPLVYTASGTFVKATYPRLRAIRVRCIGGGGAGGGSSTTAAGQASAGGGGGSGAWSQSFITDIAGLAASVAVTVGAGGSPGSGVGGNNGLQSSFAATVTAPGGGGGPIRTATTVDAKVRGGEAGVAGLGDMAYAGNPGGDGSGDGAGFGFGGFGGSGRFGGGANSSIFNLNGNAAGGPGSGGGGACNLQSQGSARSGGAGAGGLVLVELYY